MSALNLLKFNETSFMAQNIVHLVNSLCVLEKMYSVVEWNVL